MATPEPLKFFVAPHIVQDLGLNLYTSLPRVLVEFVANAYDADSKTANIVFDVEQVQREREILKKQWELEKTVASVKAIIPLDERTLPSDVRITIEDNGHGMSRQDLQDKFLIAGRRRRQAEKTVKSSSGHRFLMGRKGLGKL